NATPGAKLRAGHQKHHSRVGHLDSRPAPHYKQVINPPILNSFCSFPMSRGPPACTVKARVGRGSPSRQVSGHAPQPPSWHFALAEAKVRVGMRKADPFGGGTRLSSCQTLARSIPILAPERETIVLDCEDG